jgi:hypothetical protein
MDKSVILAANRRARCAVEVPAQPEPAELMAGEELARYLGKLAGAPIELLQGKKSHAPVRILVGARAREEACDLPLDEVRDDGFVLCVSPDRIALAGANARGTLYAAYELIERLGVRWYWPGPEGEYVPAAGDLSLAEGMAVTNPSFRFRFLRCLFSAMVGLGKSGLWQPFSSPRQEQLLDWGVKNRLNAGFWPFDDPDVTSFFGRRGGVACVDHAHALPYMVPPDQYWESHPEYFAVDEHGELFERRANEYGIHVCRSNPDVLDLVVRKALETMERNPDAGFVSISQADGQFHCRCPACLSKCNQGSLVFLGEEQIIRTDCMVDFANRVAERFCERWPDRNLMILGHHQTIPPPTIAVHPNVMVKLACSPHGFVSFNRPLEDPAGNHFIFQRAVEGWAATGTPLAYYGYNPHSSFAHAPFSAGQRFHSDIRWLHRHGFVGAEFQGEGTLWGFYGLNHVVQARTMWDVDVDFDELQKDYFRCLFRAAAEPVKALHEAFERAVLEHEPMMKGLGAFLSPEVIARGRDLIREGRDAETSDDVQGRLDVLAAQVEYGGRLMGARRTAESYHRTRDQDHLKRLVRERDAIVSYIEANPVDGAYHLGGIGGQRGNINNYLLGHLWGIDKI